MMGASWLARTAVEVGPKPSEKSSNEYWLAATRNRQVATASAFGILTVGDDLDNVQRIKAGKLWQRIHLSATKEGLAVQPMNQVHERADRELELGLEPVFGDALADLVSDPDRRGLFTFRVGYPTTAAPASPRRKAEAVSENVSA